MKRLLKAEFFKLSKEWSLWPLMLFSMVDGYLDGAVPVRYDVMITGYEMYVMRLLAGLRYEVLVCVFAAAFVYSDYKNHTLIHSFSGGFQRSQIFLAKATAFFSGILPIVLLHICVATAMAVSQNGWGIPLNDTDFLMDMSLRMLWYLAGCFCAGSCVLLAIPLTKNYFGAFGLGICMTYVIQMLGASVQEVLLYSSNVLLLAAAGRLFEKYDLI